MFPAVCLVDSSIQVSGVLGDRELPFVGLSSLGLNDQRHQAEARSRGQVLPSLPVFETHVGTTGGKRKSITGQVAFVVRGKRGEKQRQSSRSLRLVFGRDKFCAGFMAGE